MMQGMPYDDCSPSDKGWHSGAHSAVTRETEQKPYNLLAESEQHPEQYPEQEPEWKPERKGE
jgi:hypothetical protein